MPGLSRFLGGPEQGRPAPRWQLPWTGCVSGRLVPTGAPTRRLLRGRPGRSVRAAPPEAGARSLHSLSPSAPALWGLLHPQDRSWLCSEDAVGWAPTGAACAPGAQSPAACAQGQRTPHVASRLASELTLRTRRGRATAGAGLRPGRAAAKLPVLPGSSEDWRGASPAAPARGHGLAPKPSSRRQRQPHWAWLLGAPLASHRDGPVLFTWPGLVGAAALGPCSHSGLAAPEPSTWAGMPALTVPGGHGVLSRCAAV